MFASACGVPSGLTNKRSGLRPMTLGASCSRYSISIRAMCGGISNSIAPLVLDLMRRDIERRNRAWPFSEKEVHVEGKADEVLKADRQVEQDFQGERGLSQGERAEIRLVVAADLGPQFCRQGSEALQDRRIVELAQEALVLRCEIAARRRKLACKTLQAQRVWRRPS